MDPRTTLVLSTVFILLNGAVLGLLDKELSPELQPPAADWRVGTLLVAGGVALLAAQGLGLAWLVIPAANACILAGLALYWRAVRRFDGVADAWWMFAPTGVGVATVIYFLLVEPVLWIRVFVASLCGVVMLLAGAHSLVRRRSGRTEISRMALVAVLLLISAFMVFRAIYFSLFMREVGSILAPDHLVNLLSALSMAVLPIVGTTVFLAMSLQRLRSDLAQRAAELNEKSEALAAVVRSREDAERIARHDLKTPLASIAATPALLRAHRADAVEQEMLLNLVESSAKRALNMVNLSLDLYRMEQGTYEFSPAVVDLHAVALDVIDDLKPHAQSKRASMRMRGGDSAVWVHADALLCYSCIANIAKNAVEAASDGTVVTFNLSAGAWTSLAIHNDRSIPSTLRERFFEKYATHGKSGGLGLGAYSSRLIAQVQGGRLEMHTSEAEGTTLTLQLRGAEGPRAGAGEPFEPSGDAQQPPQVSPHTLPQQPPGVARRVLVVDDDTYNRTVLSAQLATLGVRSVSVMNGRYALEHCLKERPDLVFLDIHMPVMGGIETLQSMRALEVARRQAPSCVVAFSSEVDALNQARFQAIGFDASISKPAPMAELKQLLESALRSLPRPTVGEAEMPSKPGGHANADAKAMCAARPAQAVMGDIAPFFASRFALLDELDLAAQRDDAGQVRRLAHQLGGSLGMYGFDWAADLCSSIEHGALAAGEVHTACERLARHLSSVPVVAADANELA